MAFYVDVEEMLVTYLGVTFADVSVEMPNKPPLPFVLVHQVAGTEDHLTQFAIIDIHSYDGTRDGASTTARRVQELIYDLTAKRWVTTTKGVVCVDRIDTIQVPRFIKYPDENLAHYVQRIQVASRVTAATS